MTRWPLVGRERELAALASALADQHGLGFVVRGVAGVGKSRLAEECLALAVHAGLKGVRATASGVAGAIPLGAIAHLLPEGVNVSDPGAGFAALGRGLDKTGQYRWAVLVDDLHLLDATSALLLRQLMDARAIFLIATVRADQPLSEAVTALAAGDAVHHVDLGNLAQGRVDELLQMVLGGSVGRRSLHELITASGGNVLYLRELVLGALTSGALASDGEVWELAEGGLLCTPRLTELICDRIAAADPVSRPSLDLLALCEPLPLADVQAVTSPESLAGLERAGLIRVGQDGQRATVTLAHPLYGEVLRAGLPTLRRRALLLKLAERIEARGAKRRNDPLHIATWRLAATGTANHALLAQAATLARRNHNYFQAVTFLEAVPEHQHTITTRLVLGEALSQLGRWERAETILAEADSSAADERQILAVTLARTANLLWSNIAVDEAIAINAAALTRAPSPASRGILRINEGVMRIVAGQPTQGLALLDDMGTDAAQASDINSWLRGALIKPVGLAAVGRTSEALLWAERASSVYPQADEQALVSHLAIQRSSLVIALTEAGRLNDARIVGKRAFSEIGAPDTPAQIWMDFSIGRAEWLAGHPATARRWCAQAASLARSIGHIRALRLALSYIACCASLLGDLGAAQAALVERDALPLLAPNLFAASEERLGEAWVLAAGGHLTRARTVLGEAAQAARNTGYITSEALLLTDVARLGGAKKVGFRLAEIAGTCDGVFASARVHLAAALAANDPDQLLAVADELEVVGADLLAAEALTASAAAWRRIGQARRATAAAALAEACRARAQGARTPLLTAAEATALLTVREREVVLLAAAGTSSKDIAVALALSVRTVDNHLHHAYGKLGITTRRELGVTLGSSASKYAFRRNAV